MCIHVPVTFINFRNFRISHSTNNYFSYNLPYFLSVSLNLLLTQLNLYFFSNLFIYFKFVFFNLSFQASWFSLRIFISLNAISIPNYLYLILILLFNLLRLIFAITSPKLSVSVSSYFSYSITLHFSIDFWNDLLFCHLLLISNSILLSSLTFHFSTTQDSLIFISTLPPYKFFLNSISPNSSFYRSSKYA